MVGHPGVGKTLLGSRIIVKYWGRDETRRALTLAFPEKVEPFCCGHFSHKDFPEDAFNWGSRGFCVAYCHHMREH
jgi:hypothetical protein